MNEATGKATKLSSLKSLLLNLAIIIVGLSFALIILEVAMRMLPVSNNVKLRDDRPQRYYIPSAANSLRGNVFSPDTKNGLRLAVVGDSFTFGPGMQYWDTFPHKLQTIYNIDNPKPILEVLNFGTPGASSLDEVETVKKALKAKADLIILEITLNDPQSKPLRKIPIEFARQSSGLGRLLGWSAIYKFVSTRLFNQGTVRKYIEYHQNLFSNQESLSRFKEALNRIKSEVSGQGVKFAAVIFPLFDFPLDKKYPFANIHQTIKSELSLLGIESLDLFDAFYGMDNQRLQTIPGVDSHPNEIAHRIAAEAIYEWTLKNNFLPNTYQVGRVYKERKGLHAARHGKNL